MGLKVDSRELNKLLKKNGLNLEEVPLKKKKKTDAQKSLKDSVEKLSSLKKEDEIFFNEDYTKCLIKIADVTLISNNKSLRLGAKQMKDYKSLWLDRIKSLVDESMLEKWSKSLNGKVMIEFCYEVNFQFMDYDGLIASFKAPLDGLEKSGLITKDSSDHLSMILGKQQKSKNKKPNVIIMISIEEDENRYYSKEFLDVLAPN